MHSTVCFNPLQSKLEDILGNKTLYITRHSLGAALASLLIYCFSLEHPGVWPTMYAYGCPPVGDTTFAKYFEDIDSHTITILNDPVSSGAVLKLGHWDGLYKPATVKYLPQDAGHEIRYYITKLENLL